MVLEELRLHAINTHLHRQASWDTRASHKEVPQRLSRLSRDSDAAAQLAAVTKLNAGTFDLSLEDLQELFRFLDSDHNGQLEFSEIARLFKTVLQPPCTDIEVEVLFELTDKNANGLVNMSELQRALASGPFKEHLCQLQREAAAKQQLEMNMGQHAFAITREILLERLNWRVNRDDSFRTLPLSLVMLLVFITLVIMHLQVWNRQQLQRGIELWIDGYGANYPGPYHGEHVGDPTQMWEWIDTSGLSALLGYCSNATDTGKPSCPFATRSQLLGDVRLRQRRRVGEDRTAWLLHSPAAEAHLRASPGDFRGAAAATAKTLWRGGWADDDADSLDLILTSWNQRLAMFGVTEVRADFDSHGFMVPHVVCRAVVVQPYTEVWSYLVDAIYILLLAFPTYAEVKELLGNMRLAGPRRGCKQYWGFWNLVDWASIIMGWTNVVLWLTYYFATQAEGIQAVLEERGAGGLSLVSTAMSLDTAVIEAAEESLVRITRLFSLMQIVMGVNVLTIMLKFFKAFQANPRLQLVTNTLIQASDELFHFLIVFMAIFLGFSVSGHILFGDDLLEFSSFSHSTDTAFRTLLGDFGWYSDEAVSDKGLGSGMPHWMLAAWFCSYSTFVTLIILNMLLAIIMDHYTGLVMHVRSASDAPTIWKQTANYIQRARDTKGFIPFNTMLSRLRDKDNPAHVGEQITRESLVEAFDGMKVEQAEFIMNWLTKWATEQARAECDEENIARLKEVATLVRTMQDQVHVISLSTSLVTNRLHEFQGCVNSRLDHLEAGVESTAARVAEVESLLQKQRLEQGSHWARSTSRHHPPVGQLLPPSLPHAPPGAEHPGHFSAGRPDAIAAGELLSPAATDGPEPKLVGEQPAKARREKAELQPCCGPAQTGAKTSITTDRRR